MEQMTRALLPHLARPVLASTLQPGDYIRLVEGVTVIFPEVTAVHPEEDSILVLFGQGRSVFRHPGEVVQVVRASQVEAQDALTAKHRSQRLRDAYRHAGQDVGSHGLTRAQEDATYGEPPRGWEP